MRTHNELNADLAEARKRIAALRKEMLEGIYEECQANGGKVKLTGLVLEKGTTFEREVYDLRSVLAEQGGVTKRMLIYRASSTDKTTPLYQYCGHNSVEDWHLELDSLSVILEVVAGIEARRA